MHDKYAEVLSCCIVGAFFSIRESTDHLIIAFLVCESVFLSFIHSLFTTVKFLGQSWPGWIQHPLMIFRLLLHQRTYLTKPDIIAVCSSHSWLRLMVTFFLQYHVQHLPAFWKPANETKLSFQEQCAFSMIQIYGVFSKGLIIKFWKVTKSAGSSVYCFEIYGTSLTKNSKRSNAFPALGFLLSVSGHQKGHCCPVTG